MKISDHTIYASNRTPKFEKTPVSSVPSVVDTYQYSYRVNIYSGSETAWTLEKQTTFTYDGWNLIEEQTTSGSDISLTNSAFTQFRTSNYTWGLDLSQTTQGAGGVGGLLSLSIPNSAFTQFRTSNYTYIADKRNDEGVKTSNGNGLEEALYEGFAFGLIYVHKLTALQVFRHNPFGFDTAGVVKAHYEYSPFGKVVHKSGPLADKNPFQFSTKYLDNETQLYYYGHRYYNPENGRFVNRDPIEEWGGIGLYLFIKNQAGNKIDILGLWPCTCKCDDTQKDAKDEINDLIRKILEKGKEDLRKAIEDGLIGGGNGIQTGIEKQIEDLIKKKTIDGKTCSVGYGFDSSPVMKLCGKCIGADKLGHLFEEGLIYYDIVHKYKRDVTDAIDLGRLAEGLMPIYNTDGKGGVDPDFTKWLVNGEIEINFAGRKMKIKPAFLANKFRDNGLDPNGDASPADLAANDSGLIFWQDILGGEFDSSKFDICDYINNKMDHQLNPNIPGALPTK